MKKLKYLITAFIITICFNACKKESNAPKIFVDYNWTAGLEYYHDEIVGDIYLNSDRSIVYGPIKSGSFAYTYKLVSDDKERTGFFVLNAPLEGKRSYSIGIYNYSFDVKYFDQK